MGKFMLYQADLRSNIFNEPPKRIRIMVKSKIRFFLIIAVILFLVVPLSAHGRDAPVNSSGNQSVEPVVPISGSAELNLTNSGQSAGYYTPPEVLSPGINSTTSPAPPGKPAFRIVPPGIHYSSPSFGPHGLLKAADMVSVSPGDRGSRIDKNNLTASQKKLTTSLLLASDPSVLPGDNYTHDIQLSLITKTPSPDSPTVIPSKTAQDLSGELIYVYIHVLPGNSTQLVDVYVSEVTDRDEEHNLVVAWVDRRSLGAVASLECVRTIEEVIPPVVNTGSVLTQGDIIHSTANVRSLYGYTGHGMKIGVISDGVNHLSDSVDSGDLPGNVNVLSDGNGDEGTAMLEIIHDMVPDATLYFHDAGDNTLRFNAAIDALQANGCTVIVDDIGWVAEPFFEDGLIATHVSSLITNSSNPLIYISSAGNAARHHYQGDFFSDGATNFTDFSHGTDPTSKSLYVTLPPFSTVWVVLEWNDPFGQSSNDYDLYLSETKTGDLGQSIRLQTGIQDPVEFIGYTNPGLTTITAKIDVLKYRGVSKTLELYVYPSGGAGVYSNNIVAADSIFGHPAVEGVISTAAVNQDAPTVIESFSSRGPATITYPSPVIRQKPDITGVDGVAVSGAGGFPKPFYGTSAAAPHVAAVAAQIWGGHPLLSPQNIRSALFNSAFDLGPAGTDPTFGYGLADALTTAKSLNPVPVPAGNIGVFRPSARQFIFNTTPVTRATFGLGTDIPVTGDWDGDGITDIGVFRPSARQFIFNTTPVTRATFGLGTDIPVTGDWDGNGITDIGVFRPSARQFIFNTTPVTRTNFGLSTDIAVTGYWN